MRLFLENIFQENKKLTVEQRKVNLEKGPHNLIFHGMEPDWIEAEMDDDPDFIRDVIGQRMRNLIKDEVMLFNYLFCKHSFSVKLYKLCQLL